MRLTLALTTFLKIFIYTKSKKINAQVKTKNINELKEGWKDKPLHGKCPIHASDPDVNFSMTHQWLASLGLKSETEGFIIEG